MESLQDENGVLRTVGQQVSAEIDWQWSRVGKVKDRETPGTALPEIFQRSQAKNKLQVQGTLHLPLSFAIQAYL